MAAQRSNIVPFRAGTSPGEVAVRFDLGTTADPLHTQPISEPPPPLPSRGSSQPRLIPLMDFGDALRFRHPLFVVIEESDSAIVAASYDLEVAEYGDSEFEALERFRLAVVELYDAIKEMGDHAPPHLAAKLRFMQKIAL